MKRKRDQERAASRLLVLLVVCFVLIIVIGSPAREQSSNKSEPSSTATTFEAPVEPTGASRCQFCHAAEVEGYARSAMAHSLRRAGDEPSGVVHARDATITIDSSTSGYWQRLQSNGETQNGETQNGETQNYRIDYVVGSGNHAAGYLLNLNGHLFQSPIAYYKSRHAYDLAPGYEGLASPDFTRPVAEGCLFCHSGSALYVRGTPNQYRSPIFSAEAITCERCHGSAEKHLRDPRAGTIVNPAKLEPAARDSICEQCHLLGVGRVLNPGMDFRDFRPGERLEEVFTTYVNASPPGEAVKFKVISHVEQLARSTCARMSKGGLWCGTCHDPHNKPLQPVQFFRSKCLSCHTGKFPASHPSTQSNCISCHMPRRDAKDGGHTAFTDHRIQRHPQPEAEAAESSDIAAWREPAADLQKRNLGIASINTGMERRSPQFIISGYRLLAEVQQQFSHDSEIFSSMGTALLAGKQTSEAELAFERALQLSPDSVAGETNAASAYLQGGDSQRAIAHLERAVALDPLYLPAESPLIELYQQQGETAKASALSASLMAAIRGQSTPSQETSAAMSSPRPADAVFKNIQVLKGMPSDQLIPTMRFIATSLGVECGYCHITDAFEKDDKKPKQIARKMIRMMFAIDKDSFAGNREITCYSCHRGSPKPESMPAVMNADLAKPESASASGAEHSTKVLPRADQLIEKYIQALGGRSAIENVTTLQETGTTSAGGQSVAVEVFDQSFQRRAVIRHLPNGDATSIVSGSEGWSRVPGRPLREMHGSELEAAQLDADLHFPLHIRENFAELRVGDPERIDGRDTFVMVCSTPGKPPLKLYFDQQSGLLVRLVRYMPSPLGVLPTQIDYGDYREAGGVQIPYRSASAQADGVSITQFEQVQVNVAIDEERFAKPVESIAKPTSGQQ